MVQQVINIGTTADDGTGDTLRDGGDKINDNFTELYSLTAGKTAPRLSGRWYPIMSSGIIAAGSASGANTIRFTPFIVDASVTITDLGVRISVVSAGASVQAAIYASAAGLPAGTALATTGSMSAASLGSVSASLNEGSVTLAPGVYWFCTNASDNTLTVSGVSGNAPFVNSIAGSSSAAAAFNNATNCQTTIKLAQTFGTWPTISTAPTFDASVAIIANPFGIFKVA